MEYGFGSQEALPVVSDQDATSNLNSQRSNARGAGGRLRLKKCKIEETVARFKIKRPSNSKDNSSVERDSMDNRDPNFDHGSQENNFDFNYQNLEHKNYGKRKNNSRLWS